jgi:hypothetical protein
MLSAGEAERQHAGGRREPVIALDQPRAKALTQCPQADAGLSLGDAPSDPNLGSLERLRMSCAESRRVSWLMSRVVGVLALAACMVGCGASTTTPPVEVVQNYLNQLGAGNYPGACALLAKQARDSSERLAGARVSCEKLFARCLPDTVTSLPKDQTQLFYSNVQVKTTDSKASATVSGTAVARAIRHVTLAEERGNWKLTSYGEAVDRCRPRNPRFGGHRRR